ncbi:unnamed protein product [Cuscuta campestris]|uniref:RNase H type-1 domain-containing protein n=1 Tax=Cuscuta campestris TaxID=132261 RepID=A0A484N3X9_9ASTE|nr:unnamed protein product [Cuscuta campestris]
MSWNRLSVPKKFGGMGFKQLHSFNVAMLGKQGWRLLTQPDALVSRVFKVRQGVRRRVGNGRNTLVWGSPWLLDPDNPTIMTDQQFMPNLPVDFLRDPVTGGWNESLLHSYFNARDVMEILRVPSCPSREDLWFWSRFPHGHYSVKDGYRLLQGEVVAESSGFSSWNKLWRIPVETKFGLCGRLVMQQFGMEGFRCRRRLGQQLTPPSCSILGQQSSGQVQHCFVDAALFSQVGEVGFGAVLLDPGGRFVKALNGTIPCSQDPLLAEAIAVREALAWLKREACLEVQLFSDSWMVVNAINHVTDSRSYFGLIIEECREGVGLSSVTGGTGLGFDRQWDRSM